MVDAGLYLDPRTLIAAKNKLRGLLVPPKR